MRSPGGWEVLAAFLLTFGVGSLAFAAIGLIHG